MERRIATTPLRLPKSRRRDEWRGLTSARAGEIVPIAFFPLLREDRLRGRISVQIRMEEALHTIVNPIRVTVQAHLIAKTALERFNGSLETLNRSYKGEPLPGGAASPPWHVLDTSLAGLGTTDKGHDIYDALGVHYTENSRINSDLLESYWTCVNYRRKAYSKALTAIPNTTKTLAPAFWNSWKFAEVKPTFDAAMMEAAIPVSVQGVQGAVVAAGTVLPGTTPGLPMDTPLEINAGVLAGLQNPGMYVTDSDGTAVAMQVESIGTPTISLATIRMAQQSAKFAKMRERYQGIPDAYLIDLLMSGIRVPQEEFAEPILIGYGSTVIGQVERYATDGASLDQSVTNGMARLSMNLNTPDVGPGGMVLVTCEIVPEQLYERTKDYALNMDATGSAEWLPDAMRDYLDPQKVSVVRNDFADDFHSDPDGVFGYAPLNHVWNRNHARVGGRYKRPNPDAFVEDRQRIWAVEKADPALTEDFYICPQPFPHTVFADADADPFEIITVGDCSILGLTVFGQRFEEDDDHYDKVIAEVDQARLSGDPVADAAAAADAQSNETDGEVQ